MMQHYVKIIDLLVYYLALQKYFERIIRNQLVPFIEEFLSPNLCGYRKRFSTQDALVRLVEKWKKVIDNKGYTGAHPNGPVKSF